MKIKKCPFCGGKAKVDYEYGLYAVFCLSCIVFTARYDTKKEAISAWNMRKGANQ